MKGKGEYFGTHRVIKPEGLLPQAAEIIDNTPDIWSNEILIDVIALQLTATAFHSLKEKHGTDTERIKKEIYKIVEANGKFQDPVSKSGGMLIGVVKQVGEDIPDTFDVRPGDKIATLVSLSLTPLKLSDITEINLDTEQICCKGEAVLFESGIYTKIPSDLGEELSLAVMDIAGAPAQVAMNVKPGQVVVVLGAGKAGLLCLAEAKKRTAPHGTVVCIEYLQSQCEVVENLGLADVIIKADGQKPLETYNKYIEEMKGCCADFTVNTVNVVNTELTSILVTKDTGKVYFFSMSTDFVKASLGAEGVKKHATMILGSGYYPGHAEIAFSTVRENIKLKEYLIKRYCR